MGLSERFRHDFKFGSDGVEALCKGCRSRKVVNALLSDLSGCELSVPVVWLFIDPLRFVSLLSKRDCNDWIGETSLEDSRGI